ncbi:unnamed protein product [Anisakis simplex]|uniref:Skp1_POZ domain-containing protein n=1 Tax=Anisakis simplex TaxID=6269 RepID=A0A0M3KCG4_ANISI|nr:unnamed protein product [Anisakis simplex]
MQKTPSTSSFRIFKFGDKQFRINERQIVSSSKYIQKLVTNGKCPVVINLDHLKSSQPCLTVDAIDIALQYAKGRAVIALNKIVEALAASNALQMWDMRTAISEQLLKLIAVPQYAPLVIAIACVDLTADWRNTILEVSLALSV